MAIKTNIRIQVTPEQSKKIQEICFKEDVYWRGGVSKTVQHLDMPYLHISNDHGKKYLTYSNLSISLVFSGNKIEEIDAGLFISTNGTCSAPTSKKIYKGYTECFTKIKGIDYEKTN